MEINDPRLDVYRYWDQLVKHIEAQGKTVDDMLRGEFIWPRQFEIHLPGDHKRPCGLSCPHCAGRHFAKDLGRWEITGLSLLHKLKDAIPYHIYGGAYTEPIINPYYLTYLATTKQYGNHFGIHTNGTMLNTLEEEFGWLTELNAIATDDVDYLSVSLDAGFPWSWGRTKGTRNYNQFNNIIEGMRKACNIREKRGGGHAIRLCYLISHESDSRTNFESIVAIAKEIGVDSLRFSIPFGCYNQDFDEIRKYKYGREIPDNELYKERLKGLLSKNKDEKPYIFYTEPWFTDIDRYTFERCFYGYYQVSYGADGYVYRCSTSSTPTAKQCRLGKITDDIDKFKDMIRRGQDINTWNCKTNCFDKGIRCNRMGLEISTIANDKLDSM